MVARFGLLAPLPGDCDRNFVADILHGGNKLLRLRLRRIEATEAMRVAKLTLAFSTPSVLRELLFHGTRAGGARHSADRQLNFFCASCL